MSALHGFVDNLDETEYHAHPTSLSVSGAKVLLKSPALFQWQREHRVEKDAYDLGHVFHGRTLGVGLHEVIVDAADWRTKAAKEAKVAAHAAGKVPMLVADSERVDDMVTAVRNHMLATKLLSDGKPEVSAFAPDDATGILRRGRIDWLGPHVLVDLKTTINANPAAFGRHAVDFGYAMQAAWYLDLARDLGHPAQAFAFVLVEKEPPYLVTVVELDDDALDYGARQNRRALERYRDCIESGHWPGYVPDTEFTTVSLPRWAYTQEPA